MKHNTRIPAGIVTTAVKMMICGALLLAGKPAVIPSDLRDIFAARKSSIRSLRYDCETRVVHHVPNPPFPIRAGDKCLWTFESFASKGDKWYFSTTWGTSPTAIVNKTVETWNGMSYKRYEPFRKSGFIVQGIEKDHGAMQGRFMITDSPLDMTLLPLEFNRVWGGGDLALLFGPRAADHFPLLEQPEQVGDSASCLVVAKSVS